MGLREKILAAASRPSKDKEVPEWGVTVRIYGLSASASERFSRKLGGEEVPENMMAELLVLTLHDPETDEPIFTEEDDVTELGKQSGKVVLDLFMEAQKLSGLGSLEEAKNE